MQFRFLSGNWTEFWREYSQFGTNDTNAAVRSPIWLLIIALSSKLFSDPLVAHRIPSTLLIALAPVLLAEITRRFYRKDMALFVGLAAVGSQHFMFLGRIGGYVAPTTTALLFIMLCAMSVAWENSRKAWAPLVIGFMIMPMMYSTIRYMSLLAPLIIGLEFLRSSQFRRRHLIPLVVSLAVLGGYMSVFIRDSVLITSVNFFRARGEQHLLTEEMIRAAKQDAQVSLVDRMAEVITTKGSENIQKIVPLYWKDGQRFFDWYYPWLYYSAHKVITVLFLVGSVVALIKSVSNPRYLLWPLWSLLGWVPLLVTTGLTNNRMLNGLPADLFLATLGLMVPYDIISRLVGPRFTLIPRVMMLALLTYYIHFSFERLIIDCLQQCR